MGEWKRVKLGDLIRPVSETYHAKHDLVVLVNTSDVFEGKITNHLLVPNENLAGQFKKTFQKGDILFSEIRPANKRYALVVQDDTSNYIASTKLMVLRLVDKTVDLQFIYHFLTSNCMLTYLQSRAEDRSGTFPQITFESELNDFVLDLPDLPTQRRIAAVLGALDDKIEVNRKICENLEAQAQALFKAWFVDFEPFGGKRPEGWEEESLSNIATFLNGLAMQKFRPAVDESSLPVLKIKELRQGFCDEATEQCTTQLDEKYIVHDGDVVFSWSGSLLVDFWCGGDVGLNQHLFKVTSARFDKWFYYAWTQHHLAAFIKIAADKATTMGHITRDHLDDAKVLIPDQATLDQLGNVIAPMFDMIVDKRIESRALAAMRDALLPKLMSGELAVEKVEGF